MSTRCLPNGLKQNTKTCALLNKHISVRLVVSLFLVNGIGYRVLVGDNNLECPSGSILVVISVHSKPSTYVHFSCSAFQE